MFFGRRKKINCGDLVIPAIELLNAAAATGHLARVKQLVIDCGIDPNIQGINGWTPLREAAFGGHPEIVEFLLEHGADPNVQDDDGDTPLHLAALRDYCVVVKLLLNHGADPTIRNNEGDTPLDYVSNCKGLIKELRHRSGRTTVYE